MVRRSAVAQLTLLFVGIGLVFGCARGDPTSPAAVQASDTVVTELRQMQASSPSSPEYEATLAEAEAECMRSAGWEGFSPPGPSRGATYGVDTDATHGTKPFIDLYGFGMMTRFDLDAFSMPAEDPNATIYETLTEEQREELENSLGACALEAIKAHPAPDVIDLSPETVAFLDDIYERAAAEAQVAEKGDDWAGCMRRLGYQYVTREEMFAELGQSAERFAGPFMSSLNGFLAVRDWDSADALTMSDVLTDDEYSDYLVAYDREVELAQADHACETSSEARYRQAVDRLIVEAVDQS